MKYVVLPIGAIFQRLGVLFSITHSEYRLSGPGKWAIRELKSGQGCFYSLSGGYAIIRGVDLGRK